MARTKEVAFNALLAEELIARHPRWNKGLVTAEATDVLVGTPAKSPDIVVGYPGESSVIVETEFEPAATVEEDALGRLGVIIKSTGDTVEQVVAVRLPGSLRSQKEGEGIAEGQSHTACSRPCVGLAWMAHLSMSGFLGVAGSREGLTI